jgi:hypothetical protein
VNTYRFLVVVTFFVYCPFGFSQTEYLGYQGRPEPIDWGRVGRNMNGAINEANQNREARKAELDRNTLDNINFVQGKNIVTTHEAVDYLSKTFQYLVVNELRNYNAMLKNGQIDPADFSSINYNCVTQYNYAIDYCNSINYKLNLMNPNSDAYKNAYNSIVNYLRISEIKFNTTFQDNKRYKRVISQSFFITVNDISGTFGSPSLDWFVYKDGSRTLINPSLDWFINNIKGFIK